MRRVSYIVVLIFSCLIFITLQNKAEAQDVSSIWEGPLAIKTVNPIREDQRLMNPFCATKEVVVKSVPPPISSVFGNIPVLDRLVYENLGERCVVTNGQGAFARYYYSPSAQDNNFYALGPTQSATYWLDPAPGGDTVLVLSKASSRHAQYRVGIEQDFKNNSGLKKGLSNIEWRYNGGEDMLRFADGSLYEVNDHAFSENGRYLLTVRGRVLEKIDLTTMQLTQVAYRSSFTNAHISISNDGKYAAFSQSGLFVVDTTSCERTFSASEWQQPQPNVLPGCVESSSGLGAQLATLYGSGHSIDFNRLHFSSNGSSIRFSVGKNGTWNEQEIVAQNYVSTASGYLAFGDSYSSGEGDLQGRHWYELGTDEQGDKSTFAGRNLCHLSRRSYPYLLAVELGYLSTNLESPPAGGSFHSVACSGAKIHNIIGGNYGLVETDSPADAFATSDNQYRTTENSDLGLYQPGRRAQLDLLQEEVIDRETRKALNPEVISVGIGGNDADFGGFLKSCLLPGTCGVSEPRSQQADWQGMRIAAQKQRLTKVYKDIKTMAPDARIYVHGYPQFVTSNNDACGANVGVNLQERVFAAASVSYMNQIVRAAADEAGVFYVDIEDILQGGRLCDDVGDRYDVLVNGITAGDDINPAGICKLRSGCIGNETFHPKPNGHVKYADRLNQLTSSFTMAMPAAQSTSLPAPPSIFGPLTETYVVNTNANAVAQEVVIPEPREFVGMDSNLGVITINQGGFLPGSSVRVEIRSNPLDLGLYTVGEDGHFSQQMTIPTELGVGAHTVYIYGIAATGEQVIVYEPVQFAVSENDYDGDGVLNSVDSCPTIQNSFIDVDQDQVDDACDSEIGPAVIVANEDFTKGMVSPETVAGDGDELAVNENSGQVLGVATASVTELARAGLATKLSVVAGLILCVGSYSLFRKVRAQSRRFHP